MTDRFATRADRIGFSVYDTWTGETAVVESSGSRVCSLKRQRGKPRT
jgi:hypothetical protein